MLSRVTPRVPIIKLSSSVTKHMRAIKYYVWPIGVMIGSGALPIADVPPTMPILGMQFMILGIFLGCYRDHA